MSDNPFLDLYKIEFLGVTLKPNSCYECCHFAELKEPRERIDGAFVYGYCFYNAGNGHAVYQPEGRCVNFKINKEVCNGTNN